MSELTDKIWIEKYRPTQFEDLILEDKEVIVKYLDNPKSVPSFIFYSTKPGTGKTSTAKIIIRDLQCDSLMINSSDERGIETIRERIKTFSQSLSSDPDKKRCVFLDEADGLTRQAQDSLRNLMEFYSDNVFFIFTANDINKIIEPIRSRCQVINFERPSKTDIVARLSYICDKEEIEWDRDGGDLVQDIIERYYPDIRKMIAKLQSSKIDDRPLIADEEDFKKFLKLMKEKDIRAIYETVYSGDFDYEGFNKWYFDHIFDKSNINNLDSCSAIAFRLADNEKSWNLGVNMEMVFINNILQIIKIL